MRMTLKLIILFSVMTVIVTSIFSMIIYQENIKNLYTTTATNITMLCSKIQAETESYIKFMELAIEELSSNIEFMDSFYAVSTNDGIDGNAAASPAITRMSQRLYQSPLQSELYRVSAYNDEGFFVSNIFEKTGSVIPYSDEAKETIESLPILNELKTKPVNSIILGIHTDPWSKRNPEPVFSVHRAAVWHGQVIGFFEVAAQISELTDIFLLPEGEGLSSMAVLDNGMDLFRAYGDDNEYKDIPVNSVVTYSINNSSDFWVIHTRSDSLGINFYVSQEIDALAASRMNMLRKSFLTMLPVLAGALLLIVMISYRFTASIRKLNNKIRKLPADSFFSRADLKDPTIVVKPSDRELYELEQSFNTMLTTLRISHANELTLREGALTAQLNALQTQINPHFVYNTLSIISAKGLESGNEEISELCEQFALMLRYSTDTRSQTATIRQEIENIRQYLVLCKSRFEDSLCYEIDVPEQIMNITIPKLTLQPLIENCIKYGTRNPGEILSICIKGYADNTGLKLTVTDNGNGFDEEVLKTLQNSCQDIENLKTYDKTASEYHLGLVNTIRRLYYYSHGTIHVNIFNDNGAVIELIQGINGGHKNV